MASIMIHVLLSVSHSTHHSMKSHSVVMVRFTASSYTVVEGASQVQVCVELLGRAELARPVQIRVTSSDKTATGN